MTELCDIAFKYGTDKCPQIKHHFTEFYHDMFHDKREAIRKVVEIGIGQFSNTLNIKGASLYMWRDYFPNAMIYGADIDPTMLFSDNRIETFLCDQTKADDLKSLLAQTGYDIDLFVDDGSHIIAHQAFTLNIVMPLLDNGAIYVIEDVGKHGDMSLLDHLRPYEYKLVRAKRIRYRDDHMLVIRKHG